MKQVITLSALLVAGSYTINATAEEVNVTALQACSLIDNDLKRLVCYDNVVAGKPLTQSAVQSASENKQIATQTNTNAQAAAGAAVVAEQATSQAKNSNDDFGLEHKKTEQESEQDLTAEVVKVEQAPYGELILTLENKQTWRQIGTDRFRVSKGDTIVISRGMFNSFLLKKDGSSKTIRVKRTD